MPTPYQIIKFSNQERTRKGRWIKCGKCGREFYVYPSRLKQGNPKFCSRKCYDRFDRNNPFFGKKHSAESIEKMFNHPNRRSFKKGEENPNFKRWNRENYMGTSFTWWREYLKDTVGKCEVCGFDDKRILEMHHKNLNRREHTKDNLLLLCPNCHESIHWQNKTGKYHHLNHKILISGCPGTTPINSEPVAG